MKSDFSIILISIFFFCQFSCAESVARHVSIHHASAELMTMHHLSVDAVSVQLLAQNDFEDSDDDFDEFDDEFGEEVMAAEKIDDPLESYNRSMYKFNKGFYDYFARPLAVGFTYIVPEPARVSLANFFNNLFFPFRLVNNLLQLKFRGAGREIGRFLMNTTVGIGGLFNPAGNFFGWEPSNEDFGQTLGYWGVGPGFSFVIPLLGQSNLRDSFMILPNFLVHPANYVYDSTVYIGFVIAENFNLISLHYEEIDGFTKDSFDPYIFVRDAYSQNRIKLIKE